MTVEAAVRLLASHAGVRVERIGRSGWRMVSAPPRRTPATAALRATPPAPSPAGDIVVLASKRGAPSRSFAGSFEVIDAPRVGIEAGSQALVTRSTIISSTFRGAGRDKLFIRGIADSSLSGRLQSATAIYLGEVPLTYSAADPDLQLYDIASVEILQGPQGTR